MCFFVLVFSRLSFSQLVIDVVYSIIWIGGGLMMAGWVGWLDVGGQSGGVTASHSAPRIAATLRIPLRRASTHTGI